MDKTFEEAQADYEMAEANFEQARKDWLECRDVRDRLCKHLRVEWSSKLDESISNSTLKTVFTSRCATCKCILSRHIDNRYI